MGNDANILKLMVTVIVSVLKVQIIHFTVRPSINMCGLCEGQVHVDHWRVFLSLQLSRWAVGRGW